MGRIFALIIFSWVLVVPCLGTDQDQEHERIVEKVTVTNIEVPVRVLHKGEPVADLTIEDFIIYENKKKMKINGFFLKRKTFKFTGTKEIKKTVKGTKEKIIPPRTFVLVFSVTDFNDNLKEAVDYVFEKVLRKNDRLLIFANDRSLEFPAVKEKEKIKMKLLNGLREEAHKARRRLIDYIKKIETYLSVHDFRVSWHKYEKKVDKLIRFLKKYRLTWNEYKSRYLNPPVDRFYYFSKYLENIKGEKWVLNFYQFELYPKIRLGSDLMLKFQELASSLTQGGDPTYLALGRALSKVINLLLMDLNVPEGYPIDEISKLFYKVEATFHSFFIRTTNRAYGNEFDYKELSTDLEQTLKAITDATGGKNITSNNLVQSLQTVQELEDVYYILTYVPRDPNKAGKLKIKVKGKSRKYKVLYDDNFRADYISEYLEKLNKAKKPGIKIENFSFKGKVLAFTVTDFQRKEPGKESTKAKKMGKIKVRIRLTDKENAPLYDQAKVLTARETEMNISLKAFKTIKSGEYNFVIDAQDIFTGKEANFHRNIIIK